MSRIKTIKMLGMVLAAVLIIVGILPIIRGDVLTNDSIATSIILILLGVAYLIISFKPEWTKAVFFFEGIVIGVVGYSILAFPYNIGFAIIGLLIIAIAILAYLMKLPQGMLKFFYRESFFSLFFLILFLNMDIYKNIILLLFFFILSHDLFYFS